MRILITGSRDWTEEKLIYKALNYYHSHNPMPHTLVSGCCPTGADQMAEEIALDLGWTVEQHPAEWDRYGKAAGPLRNQEMVNRGADLCLAFILNKSKGATHCSNAAEKAGIRTVRWEINDA